MKKENTDKLLQPIWIVALMAIIIPLLASMGESESLKVKKDVKKPKFSLPNWFDGKFQLEYEDYFAESWKLKDDAVKINNSLVYSAFNQIRVKEFTAGKNDYIFSIPYVNAAFGNDFVGEDSIQKTLTRFKLIQDTLKSKGIDFLFTFVPGKGSFFPELLPERFDHKKENTNYKSYIKLCKEMGINYIDLQALFLAKKEKSPYPLFPQFGHHWSYYGECVAADTVVKFIEKMRGIDMPDIQWEKIEVSDTARHRDGDILKSMNLMNKPEQTQKLAYPVLTIENNPYKIKAKVLTIADSYYWGFISLGIQDYVFEGGSFWYYYKKAYPETRQQLTETWQLDLKSKVESQNVIMIAVADGNLVYPGWGFIEEVYELYANPQQFYSNRAKKQGLNWYEKKIHSDAVLLRQANKESDKLKLPLDTIIKRNAIKLLKENNGALR